MSSTKILPLLKRDVDEDLSVSPQCVHTSVHNSDVCDQPSCKQHTRYKCLGEVVEAVLVDPWSHFVVFIEYDFTDPNNAPDFFSRFCCNVFKFSARPTVLSQLGFWPAR